MAAGSALLTDGRLGQLLVPSTKTGAGGPVADMRGAAPDLTVLTAQ